MGTTTPVKSNSRIAAEGNPTKECPIRCGKCGRVLGYYKQVGNRVWLAVGNLVLKSLSGRCICGREFYYTASEEQLARLVNRIMKNRQEYGKDND